MSLVYVRVGKGYKKSSFQVLVSRKVGKDSTGSVLSLFYSVSKKNPSDSRRVEIIQENPVFSPNSSLKSKVEQFKNLLRAWTEERTGSGN